MKKHEQIALAVLGYIIGFVTAFIGFELTETRSPVPQLERNEGEYGLVATVHDNNEKAISTTMVDEHGLFAKIGAKNRIISANALPPDDNVAGYHYAVSNVLVSPDKRHLYYCAQVHPDDSFCYSFLYSVENDTLYPMKIPGGDALLAEEMRALAVSWTADNTLALNGWTSASSDAPWVME